MKQMSIPLKQLIIVCGYGSSDIGKGWLAASIAKVVRNTQVIKIDPFLNQTFPANIGIEIDSKILSDDLSTYRSMGIQVEPAYNIINGQILSSVMAGEEKRLQRGDIKKLTFADLAEVMALKLLNVFRMGVERIVIEIGGTITDREHAWIPDALRFLAQILGVTPQIVLLTYLERSESGYPVKTQNVRNAIRSARANYGLPIFACFVRRRFIPETVSSEDIRRELFNVAFETQFPINRLILEENYSSVHDLGDFISSLHLNRLDQKRVFVSACLMGNRCRYNGKGSILDSGTLASLHSAEVITACPEVLGGLGIPRKPCEIQYGDGCSVLEGKARVKNIEGVDMTDAYLRGAERTFRIIQQADVSDIYLCEGSPTCGLTRIYDGSFSDIERDGMGVLGAILSQNGYGHLLHAVRPGPRA